MKIIAETGREDIAIVYIAELREGKFIEFVESLQPPIPREKKWVLLVSTMFGCPVGCVMCDAGGFYQGKLCKDEMFDQIDFLVKRRFPDGKIPVEKFKIQFARMGEPAFSPDVIDVMTELPGRYDAPGLLPAISTVAPLGTDKFFEKLLAVKRKLYTKGRFQLQFSIHTTDEKIRDRLIPVKKWSFSQIAEYGEEFYEEDDRKITLNFALGKGIPVEPDVLLKYFSPEKFLVKITPVNPTYQAVKNNFPSYINSPEAKSHVVSGAKDYDLVNNLRLAGYEVLVSIGELEENHIGSNCGQYITRHLEEKSHLQNGYTYKLKKQNSL